MAVSLIGFLGRGPYAPDGKRRPYFKARYKFDDWVSEEVTFFLHAVLGWLREHRRKRTDRVIVLGTAGSMWDELVLTLCASRNGDERERIERLYFELVSRVDAQCTTPKDLGEVEKVLSRALEIETHTEMIPAGETPEEQAKVLAALQRHVQADDRVYIDVTHGYRHQPMLALGAAVLLSRLRRARIEDIFYGANEMRRASNAPAPVVSLRWLLDLLRWAESVHQLRLGGQLGALPRVVRDERLQEALADTAFFLSTNQVHQAGEAAEACRRVLAKAAPDPILDLTRDAIESVLTEVSGCQRNARGILAVARTALREQDFVRTSILLCEAVRKHEQLFGPMPDPGRVSEIDHLRNALAHAATKTSDDAVRHALSSRAAMKDTLQKHLDWVAAQVQLNGWQESANSGQER